MKKIITGICLLVSLVICGQAPTEFNCQIVVRDTEGNPLNGQALTINVSIVDKTSSWNEVFSEEHNTTTSQNGIVNMVVGSGTPISGSLENVDWFIGNLYLHIRTADRVIQDSRILSIPFTKYANAARTAESGDFSIVSGKPDFTNWDTLAADDFSGVYDSLHGDIPQVITEEQRAKTDLISLSNSVDLNDLQKEIDTNNAIVGFPGFGFEDGKAIQGNWIWEYNNGNMYHNGSVGINVGNPNDIGDIALKVNGGVLYDGIPADNVPGILFYDPNIDNGSFCFYDNDTVLQVLNTGYNDPEGAFTNGYFVHFDDFETNKHFIIGDDATPDYQAQDNTMVMVEKVLRIWFWDTSNSGSFPSTDWELQANDIYDTGTNHFSIKNVSNNRIPFKIEGGLNDSAFYCNPSGNVGLGKNPTEKLDVDGSVAADIFIGSAKLLTGVNLESEPNVINEGSTTLNADSDENGQGQIDFKVDDSLTVVISNEGNIGVGSLSPVVELDVNGTGLFTTVSVDNKLTSGSLSRTFKEETTLSGFIFNNYDLQGNGTIIFNSSSAISVYSLNEPIGTELTLINKHPTNTVTLMYGLGYILNPTGTNIILNQYESAKIVKTAAGWTCLEVVEGI